MHHYSSDEPVVRLLCGHGGCGGRLDVVRMREASEGMVADPDGECEFTCRKCAHPHRISKGALGALVFAAFGDSTRPRVPPVTLTGASEWVSTRCDTTVAPSGNGRLWERRA